MDDDNAWPFSSATLEASFSISINPHACATMTRIAPCLVDKDGRTGMLRLSIDFHSSHVSMSLLNDGRLFVDVLFVLVFNGT